MVYLESLKTTIIDSVIPLNLIPNQQEALQAATQFLYLAEETIQDLKSGNLKSFAASKGFPFNPNIPLITLRFIEIEKSKNFKELDELLGWLIKIRKKTEKPKAIEEKFYKTKEGLSTFLELYLPPLNLSLNLRLLIDIHVLNQLNPNLSLLPFPERFKRKIPGNLQRKIGSYCQHFMQAACSTPIERVYLQNKSIRQINHISYTPFFLNVQVALKKALEEEQPIALFLNGMRRALFKPIEGVFQPISLDSLQAGQGILAFYLKASKTDVPLSTPEDLILPAAAMMPQYPAEPERVKRGIPLFTEKPETDWLEKIRRLKLNSQDHSFKQLCESYLKQTTEQDRNEWTKSSEGRYELHELAEAYDDFVQMRKKWHDQAAHLSIESCEALFAKSLHPLST
ncbi:MAG: hypothetical protein ACK5MA_08410 [Parachlamydiaceae bacterium]